MVNIKATSLFLLPLLAYAAPLVNTGNENGLDVANVDVDQPQTVYARDETYDVDADRIFDAQKRDSLADDIYDDIQARGLTRPKPAVVAPGKPNPKTPSAPVKPLNPLPKPGNIPRPKKSDELLIHHPSPADYCGGRHHKRAEVEDRDIDSGIDMEYDE